MNKNSVRSDVAIKLLLVVSFLLKAFSYQDKSIGWDESTYLAIGKYFYSWGQVGFIEAFRPIVWPLIVGLFWKLHFDVFFIGGIIQIFFGLGSIYCVYLIGTKVFNQGVGLLAAVLFSLSSTYYYCNTMLLTDIPSTFLGLWAVYLLLDKKYFLSGLIGMLAFLTRFTQSLTVELMFIFLLVNAVKSKQVKSVIRFVMGMACLLLPYLLYNYLMHGNMLAFYIDSKIGYSQFTSPWHEGIILVLSTLFTNESWVFIFILPALVYILFNDFRMEVLLLLAIGIAQFLWIGKLPVEIVRYLISCLPYLYMMSALGIYVVYSFLTPRFRLLPKIFILIVMVFVLQLISRFNCVELPHNPINAIQRYTMTNYEHLKGKHIWMSNPKHFTYVDLKIDESMFYPRFNVDKIAYLRSHLSNVDYIFLDSSNLGCNKETSSACEDEKWKLIDQIRSEFHEEVSIPSLDPKKNYAVYKKIPHFVRTNFP